MNELEAVETLLNLQSDARKLSYGFAYRQFKDLIGKSLIEARVGDAVNYVRWLQLKGYSDATQAARRHALSSLSEGLIAYELMQSNPFKAANKLVSKRQKKQIRPTKLVPRETVKTMLSIPDRSSKNGLRDACLLFALFGGGLRINEATALNVGDVRLSEHGTLVLILRDTKAGKLQEQPLPMWAGEVYSDYVRQRMAEGAENHSPLFVFYYADGRIRGRLSVKTMQRKYAKYAMLASGEHYGPHSARATSATRLSELGKSDREVARHLRHKDIRMVETYVKRFLSADNHPALDLDNFA